MADLAIRFVLGASIVSAFSLVSEAFKPKRFSGMFSAAPSIALVTLAMTFATQGRDQVAIEGRSMALGGIAFGAYCGTCVLAAKRAWCPVWVAAAAGWLIWGGIAFGAWRLLLVAEGPR